MKIICLKSVEEEKADCLAACANLQVGDWANFIHHEYPIEILFFTPQIRADFISNYKDPVEQPLRFRMFRPAVIPEELSAKVEWKEAVEDLRQTVLEYNSLDMERNNLRKIHVGTSTPEEVQRLLRNQNLLAEVESRYYSLHCLVRDLYAPYFEQVYGRKFEKDIFSTFLPVKEGSGV